ncbi:hypothetical protein Ancab_028141 [Ancistrocladus abbreviatus]
MHFIDVCRYAGGGGSCRRQNHMLVKWVRLLRWWACLGLAYCLIQHIVNIDKETSFAINLSDAETEI